MELTKGGKFSETLHYGRTLKHLSQQFHKTLSRIIISLTTVFFQKD